MSDFDAEESEIIEPFEADQLKPMADKDAELQAFKKRALVEGIPYQTLVARVCTNM